MILLSLKRIEKSLLKLALEGSLSKLYRRSSPTLSAFNEINTYNEAIKEKRKDLEKELKKLESTLKKVGKRDFSFAMQTQNAVSLENDKKACHTDLECSEREVSKNTESQLVILSECEKSTKELKQILNSLSVTLWSYLYENSYDTCYDGLGTCVAPIKDYE
ncbi:hypothetical protein HRAG_01495 [Helicobacter bilis ATCC 43879]|uniref:Uncharacterized protein n=1 Tax=Helicobacter bilis ATCC 43879 TaxID=613026 RepID=C3XHE9_9HELI|nr:hypothetical protein HRAG_01495 [Helicobacter bilis ATCC 43879]